MYSKKMIPRYMPNAELVIRSGYQHCGYMAAEPKAYVGYFRFQKERHP